MVVEAIFIELLVTVDQNFVKNAKKCTEKD
jgi:hypothetical protein